VPNRSTDTGAHTAAHITLQVPFWTACTACTARANTSANTNPNNSA
jgi:hypothetical protein